MELQLVNGGGSVKLSDQAFSVEFNEGLVHQVVTAYLAGARQGTVAQKTRSEVRGGGIKPWRQKGTGRARAGTIRSPIWVGGGKAFAAKPRNYQQKVNKKMFHRAMTAILSELVRQERLRVTKEIAIAEPKTKAVVQLLKDMQLENVLIVTSEHDTNLFLAARNLPHVEVIRVADINPVNLIAHEHVLMTVDALQKVEEKLS